MPDPKEAANGLPDPSTPGYALTRTDLEAEEERRLAPYAMKSARARRRLPLESEGRHFDYRTEYQRDRDRILYSRAFRRLRQKTQVFLPGGGDHYRNRMTHTMEVAQISRTIARALRLNEDLVEAICLGHDLGHPPFAHSGEKVLHEILAGEAPLGDLPGWPGGDLGGFKHNYQSLRVVDRLEKQYPHPGLNLTCEVREGILKHTGLRTHIAYPDLDAESVRVGKPCFFEGQVGALADDLAQQIHDCDDGMRDGLVEIGEVEGLGVAREIASKSGAAYTGVRSAYVRRNLLIRGMTHLFVTNVIARSAENLRRFAESAGLRTTDDFYATLDAIPPGMIQLTERGYELYEELREFVYRRIISSLVVSRADVRARMFVLGLFRACYADPRLLEDYVLLRFKEAAGPPYLRDVPLPDVPAEIARRYHGNPTFIRLVCDHIAGMTDKYAVEEYDRIYSVHPQLGPGLP